ncbi:GNAT family N-acetyltransferase [Vibrio parahaemolyticus]|uniref:GNAT family N-acetyltransferase n=1 Tax=Vibrio parahaemolyticus TaxID=670 RepID=UPI002809874F|nr:GNAT family N-acetyltransferase [Vibrio parahaemolyticus]ELA8172077.1 GNAT family N-acetyltransferase [Vibrio parahaemolyticus]MDS1911556.1 GNAT family N-acetyltransferase [Vibrio parahaemolyticus]
MNSIEKASKSDIEALLDIQVSAFSIDQKLCGSGPPGYDDHEYQLKAMKRYSYYVIKHKSDVVGGFYFSVEQDSLKLLRLFVAPTHQGLGIGTFALDFLLEIARPGTVIELETPTFSTAAQRFYEKNGFRKAKLIDYGSSQSYQYSKSVT